ERRACESPEWAFKLRCRVPDLDEDIRRLAELSALRFDWKSIASLPNLHVETKRVLDLLRSGVSLQEALASVENGIS
ncbi:MAG: hypothetical protein ONA69_03115, partial [candidate division KSB1 bacterium]|nr:hypothetical protein [candidate division KSB1 bacterium]